MSLRTELEVSTWVASTALILWLRSARSASATRSRSNGLALPKSITWVSMPSPVAMSAQPWPNRPVAGTNTVSPGASTLTSAASQVP